jgi:hypothetical protein
LSSRPERSEVEGPAVSLAAHNQSTCRSFGTRTGFFRNL